MPDSKVEPAFMSVKDTAVYLSLSEREVYNLYYEGELGADIKRGSKRLLDFQSVKAYAKRLREGAA
jgi:excisionase family DNA binding protein